MNETAFFEQWLVRACFYAGWAAAERFALDRQYESDADERAEACAHFLNGEDFAAAVRQAADVQELGKSATP